jgi:hypothetical protein
LRTGCNCYFVSCAHVATGSLRITYELQLVFPQLSLGCNSYFSVTTGCNWHLCCNWYFSVTHGLQLLVLIYFSVDHGLQLISISPFALS